MIGVWERINIGVFMLWVLVLAVVLLRTVHKESEQLYTKTAIGYQHVFIKMKKHPFIAAFLSLYQALVKSTSGNLQGELRYFSQPPSCTTSTPSFSRFSSVLTQTRRETEQ